MASDPMSQPTDRPAPPLRVLSLGAGVQSTTLALMAAHGEIPPIDHAIFADTQSEPKAVYDHLHRLIAALPFPVHIVTAGSLRQEILDACSGKRGAWGRPPLFVKTVYPAGSVAVEIEDDGTPFGRSVERVREREEIGLGMTRRQCTQDYKLDVIYRTTRTLVGIKPRSKGPKRVAVEQLIGISIDEAGRQKDARFRWVKNTYPLIELGMNRRDCEKKLAAWGWSATKSACTFCPYHSDQTWLAMKRNDPESWQDAVTVDRALRSHHGVAGFRGHVYLHSERIPLEEVDFEKRLAKPRSPRQQRLYLSDGFGNECEGLCGV